MDSSSMFTKQTFNVAVFVTALLLLAVVASHQLKDTRDGYNYDDAKIINQFKIIDRYNEFTYQDPLNVQYSTFAFLPQEAVINSDGVIALRGFFGEKLFLVPFFAVVGDIGVGVVILQMLFILLIALASFILGSYFSKTAAWGLMLGLSPLILVMAPVFFPQLFLLAMGCLLLVFIWKTHDGVVKTSSVFLLGLLFGVLTSAHYLYFLFLLVYFFFAIVRPIPFNRKCWLLFCFFIAFSMSFLPNLLFNYEFLGSPFETQYTSYVNPYIEQFPELMGANYVENRTFTSELLNYYLFNDGYLVRQWGNAKLLFVLVSVMIPGALFGFFAFSERAWRSKFCFVLMLLVIMWLVVGGFGDYFGEGSTANLRPSLLRYLILPLFLFNLMGLLWIERKLSKGLFLVVIVVVIALSFSVVYSDYYPFNIYVDADGRFTQLETWNSVKSELLNVTSNNSVIFTEGYDYGFMTSERAVFNYYFIPEQIRASEAVRVMDALLLDGREVCIFRRNSANRRYFFNPSDYVVSYNAVPSYNKAYELTCVRAKQLPDLTYGGNR